MPKNIDHFRVFGSKCYIKGEDDRVGKLDSQVDKGILVGYSRKINTDKFNNLGLNKIVKNINLNMDETNVSNIKEEIKNSKE
jgi:hypothetical protein